MLLYSCFGTKAEVSSCHVLILCFTRRQPEAPSLLLFQSEETRHFSWLEVLQRNKSDYEAMFWVAHDSISAAGKGVRKDSWASTDGTDEASQLLQKAAGIAPPSAVRGDILRHHATALTAQGRAAEAAAALLESTQLVRAYGSLDQVGRHSYKANYHEKIMRLTATYLQSCRPRLPLLWTAAKRCSSWGIIAKWWTLLTGSCKSLSIRMRKRTYMLWCSHTLGQEASNLVMSATC